MTYNTVSVTVAASKSPADAEPAEGNILAAPDGVMWPDTSGNPIVPDVVHAYLQNGTCTFSLVASDNFAAGVLGWSFIINIRGLPTVNVANVPVNFSSGASQNLWTILSAAGWTPIGQP